MAAAARQIFELTFVIAWVGGALILLIRMRLVQVEYFSRFAGLI